MKIVKVLLIVGMLCQLVTSQAFAVVSDEIVEWLLKYGYREWLEEGVEEFGESYAINKKTTKENYPRRVFST